jgi:hypothetical protein
VHSHELTLEKGPHDAIWLLEFDEGNFYLTAPDGEVELEDQDDRAHRLIDHYALYAEGKICLRTPTGSLVFKPHKEAVKDLRELFEARLRSEPEYVEILSQGARGAIPFGFVLFIVAGGLFALYCWWASWAPDPPPGHWLRWLGWLIHGALLLLLAVSLAGASMVVFGVRELQRLRRIARPTGPGQNSRP